jgi:hypothetical protein
VHTDARGYRLWEYDLSGLLRWLRRLFEDESVVALLVGDERVLIPWEGSAASRKRKSSLNPMDSLVQSIGFLLMSTNEGTELPLPVYELVHRSQRREVAGWGLGCFLRSRIICLQAKKKSLGATSWRRYPRTLAPESYTRPILGAKSIRFRWSFTNVLQQADWFCQAVPWPVYCVRYTCPIETLRRPARLLAVDMNICENLMAISKHCDRRLWRKAQVIEAQSIRYDGHVMG